MKIKSKHIALAARVILGLVFIFSGFMKAMDTWGTVAKTGDYLTAFGMSGLLGTASVIAVVQIVIEFALGVMMLVNVRPRLTAWLMFVAMIFFTLLTFVIAVWNPLDDCGCFSDAVKIDNWQSFGKNVILLGLSILVFVSTKGVKVGRFSRSELIIITASVVISAFLSIYSFRHLPVIDMFAYRKNVDLREDILCTKCLDNETVLVYKNLKTGELREFKITDTEWYDSNKWRYVDTRTAFDNITPRMLDRDFAVYDGDDNVADRIVDAEGRTYMIIINTPENISEKCDANIVSFVERQTKQLAMIDANAVSDVARGDSANADNKAEVMLIVPDDMTNAAAEEMSAKYGVRYYKMSAEVMALILRADVGVVAIDNGKIAGKLNCRNMYRDI